MRIKSRKQSHPIEPMLGLENILEAKRKSLASKRRFAERCYLQAVYRLCWRWKRKKVLNRRCRELAKSQTFTIKRNARSLKVVIDITFREADAKLRSRWARALQFVSEQGVPPKKFGTFLRRNGGVGGCARRAASVDPKRKGQRNDWEPFPLGQRQSSAEGVNDSDDASVTRRV